MNSRILGLPSLALMVGLIVGTVAQAQSGTVYEYTMVIDPVTYDGQLYAGGSVSFALPSAALPNGISRRAEPAAICQSDYTFRL